MRHSSFVLNKTKANELLADIEFTDSVISIAAAKNAKGFDIYITPVDEHFHYILVDDMTIETLCEFKRRFKPSVVFESSKGNFQAVLIVEKNLESKLEAKKVHSFFIGINKIYGDKGMKGGVVHAFRLAGFRNKKPNKNFLVKMIDFSNTPICCDYARHEITNTEVNDASNKDLFGTDNTVSTSSSQVNIEKSMLTGHLTTESSREYLRQLSFANDFLTSKECDWRDKSQSVADWRAASRMARLGHSVEQIALAIRSLSPRINKRKRGIGGADTYAFNTATKAFKSTRKK